MDVETISGEWLTYADAALRLEKSEPAVRIQARRENWPTRKRPGGRAEVCVPGDDTALIPVQTSGNGQAVSFSHDATTLDSLFRQVGELSVQKGKLTEQLASAKRDLSAADRQIKRLLRQIDELERANSDS